MREFAYRPTEIGHQVLTNARILAPRENPQQMFERVVHTLFAVETEFNTPPEETLRAQERFAEFLAGKAFTPGTPTLNNAGRLDYADSALSSCAIIPVDLRKKDESIEKIRAYYRQNMGSGFDFTPYEDPVGLLIWLNELSAQETATGKYDRYIGNMGNLHVSHPQIKEFIKAKRERHLLHFNLSVDVSDEFMKAAIAGKEYTLRSEERVNAHDLLNEIAQSAWVIGDPSIINLERMNRDNPLVDLLPYTTTPPCSEMGMATGETCQFGYINIAYFVKPDGVDYPLLAEATRSLTRALDNAVQISAKHYPDPLSSQIARFKRKIGIALSGIADTLLYYGIPYDSQQARQLVRDTASCINFASKVMSVELAEERGSCEAMQQTQGNRYYDGYLGERYAHGGDIVSPQKWQELSDYIRRTGKLRNILTTAQPPAARVSILMDCSPGIEPIFGIPSQEKDLKQPIRTFVEKHAGSDAGKIIERAIADGSFQNTDLPGKECLKTAKEISSEDHLLMIAALAGENGVIDEAVSKTVNLPKEATVGDVLNIFTLAHKLGLKNIAVYRDGSIENQPFKL